MFLILGYGECGECTSYSIYCDEETGLCWQDPQRQAYNYRDIGVRGEEAVQYCQDLVLGGYDDWRIPTVYELRGLVGGNPNTQPDGPCPVDDNCTFDESWADTCLGGELWEGPGDNGCYFKDGITGTCDKLDLYSSGHYLEHFASDLASDDEHWMSTVMFEMGSVIFNHICTVGDVRCVREGPSPTITCEESAACIPNETKNCPCDGYEQPDGVQTCAEDGSCWGPCECLDHTRDPAVSSDCFNDVCGSSDAMELIINLPEGAALDSEPHMLIAFYYDADTWQFPPARPPDGGTNYNQIINPGMPPYRMIVPGCTYYGESSLEGNFQLYVQLQMEKSFPPIPKAGDYWWGYNQPSVGFPFDGTAHQGTVTTQIVTLDGFGCNDPEQPYMCGDFACVAEVDEC
jgi:hypothetical protein